MRQFKPGQLQPGLLYDITSSYALTASYALNQQESYRIISGSISAAVNPTDNVFLIKNGNINILSVTQSGVLVLATQSAELSGAAPVGGIYFTSSSFFVGLE